MKFFVLILLFINFVYADEFNLDNLLKKYQDAESLYKKTKQENAGFLVTYSREDLEQMQAYKLKDVLKTIRLYTMQINNFGISEIKTVGASSKNLMPLKLYIDDFEITSFIKENPLAMYENMDIYFIDHIEIYQGGSSIAFGNEVGSMVIRLYTKDPKKENSKSFQISVDSRNSVDNRIFDAGIFKDYKYLAYVDISNEKFKKYNLNDHTLSKDLKRYQTHFKLSKENNFDVEFNGILNDGDSFKGFGTSPSDDNKLKKSYTNINFTKYFTNNLKFSTSISGENSKATLHDDIGFILADNSLAKNFDFNIHSRIYKISLEKKISLKKHDILIGTQFLEKRLKIDEYKIDNKDLILNTNKVKTYMLYFEDMYNLNENNLLSLSGKVDSYINTTIKNTTEYSARLAYINILNDNWKYKVFLTRRYIYPSNIQNSFTMPVYNENKNLDSAKVKMLAGELEYKDDKYRILFGYAYKEIDKAFIFNMFKKQYENKDGTVYFRRAYIKSEYNFNIYNKIVAEVFRGYKKVYNSSSGGLLIQLFNKIGKFSLYNELVYRSGYSISNIKIDAGYDWTMSVSYPLTKQINLKLKGENILDKASKSLIDINTEFLAPSVESKMIVTMEYTF